GSFDRKVYALGLLNDPPTYDPLTPPSGLDAAPGDGVVRLSWISRGAAPSFTVERTITPNDPNSWATIAPGLIDVQYDDTNVVNGTIYYYRVRGILDDGTPTNPSPTRVAIPTRGIPNWLSKDVDTELAGSADVLPDGQTWKISGSGRDIFDN